MFHLQNLLDDAKCYDEVRERCWPEGVRCPHCASSEVTRQGYDTAQPSRRKYRCYFDLMGLNLSNEQIRRAVRVDAAC
ncbi:Insertion element protein (fragment) [Candidatus Accumulibacter aalborgensis]|uniref:Insertion element protein n=1 Tax=Candidatus Accumulibacter aalborgensis TaxID=1860102 RepID=A0A1A8XX68_9PROT